MPETMSFLVPPEADGERLDKWLSRQDSLGLTRSSLQNRMEHGDVTVNGRTVSKNYRQKAGDTILVTLPEPESLELQPENIPLDIVYEDDAFWSSTSPKGWLSTRHRDIRPEHWYTLCFITAATGFPALTA